MAAQEEHWVRLSVIASFFTFFYFHLISLKCLKEEMLNIFIPYPDRKKLGTSTKLQVKLVRLYNRHMDVCVLSFGRPFQGNARK